YAQAVTGMFLVMIPYGISIFLAFRSGNIGRDPYRLLYLFSMVTFVIYGPLTKTLFEGDMFLPGIVPNMFLILSQCVMLSRSYAQAHEEVERVNTNLEDLVKQRTAQLNSANEQLAASQSALREMISNISHDLKTPLTVLNNYLELLGDETVASSEQERTEYLGIAYHKNLDLQRLIHNLFEVTRMEGGTVSYRLEWVMALPLMEEAERKYGDLAGGMGLFFTAEADDALKLKIDRNKIWSVLDNLVYNALRHTPEGGSIALGIKRRGDRAVLTVADTGEGIDAGHLPHIFERFYKVSPERGEKDGSSGLGLYIVKTTAEAMGGTVEVESVPGKGTVFTLTFPAN
ncbi:MAG: HAMP domain-containing sensor histidine kinase, partial [Hungatella hathewayi]|nr:HAMP domain-containing sensor histidine kinase [Hungatella hathewayi]